MIKLTELFAQLSVGELSNLSMANEGDGTIAANAKPKLILHLNEALLRLYTKYVLKERDVLVEMVEHITNYHLLARFAEQHTPVLEKYTYIKDTSQEKFKTDAIRILSVWDTNGCKLPLNDDAHEFSLFTPQANVLQVRHPQAGKCLVVYHQCRHLPVVLGDITTHDIECPDTLLGALRAYIAYLVYGNINTKEAQDTAQMHQANYERICAELTMQDILANSLSNTNVRFKLNGWI